MHEILVLSQSAETEVREVYFQLGFSESSEATYVVSKASYLGDPDSIGTSREVWIRSDQKVMK